MNEPLDTPEWHAHVVDEFRRNGGVVEHYGRVLVLLHHRGARTGAERVTPIVGIPDGHGWLAAASWRGAAHSPAWFYNVLAHPDAAIETPGAGTVAVRASQLHGAERERAWALFTSLSPLFAQYQARTERLIPLLRLSRR
jgi:deazaflavin-dependent oxidoreductase (nitroreductase family)